MTLGFYAEGVVPHSPGSPGSAGTPWETKDIPPDRLCVDPKSPFHDAALLERGVGVLFNGVDRNNVEEYCVSEGWVRLAVGKTVDRHGNSMTVKYKGKVEPYWR